VTAGNGCAGMLDAYPTSLEEDEGALERWAPHTGE
jgi:hypothetical protein